jgi:hypothetical protein
LRRQVVIARPDRRSPSFGVVALLCAHVACGGGTSGPDAGRDVPIATDPRAAICSEAEAGSSHVSYDVVQAIFNQNCVICHSAGNDLNLQAGVSWSNLVNQPAPTSEACGGTLVVPGSPAGSYLYQKLTNPAPCSGSQMPRTDLFPDPLPGCVTALVAGWIAEGAAGPVTDGGGER